MLSIVPIAPNVNDFMPSLTKAINTNKILACYFLLTYLLVLFIAADSIELINAWHAGAGAFGLVMASWLCYGWYYLLPAVALTSATNLISHWFTRHHSSQSPWPAYIVAILTGGITTLLFYANAKIHALYGTFINGFIINLITTPGGIESLGGSNASNLSLALIGLGFFALQALLLLAIHQIYQRPLFTRYTSPSNKATRRLALLSLILTSLGVHLGYAAEDAFGKASVTELIEQVPFFQPVTAKSFFKLLGAEVKPKAKLNVDGRLNYPLKPFNIQAPRQPYNIIWLTSESWRADMLNPDVMPETWRFAAQAQRFTNHYSGGNGTRMGVFSMFTGLPGNYWFPFLRDQRGAAMIDVLQQQQYQISLYTSALFSYPEFDRTIFSHVPSANTQALQHNGRAGWENDRSNVDDMLHFIDTRDPLKPFFTFMFFESPHARYHFPEESVIRRPYKDDINYATLSKAALAHDMPQIKNRYINAVHHLDSQFARVMQHLREKNLLDNTIVIMVGDHGEEFMEHGYWGHNSTFVNEQVRTPLVLWLPGMKAKVHTELSSHMDIVPTLMPYLGVTNTPADYSLGHDLINGAERQYTYMSDWNRIAYLDHTIKSTMNINGYSSGTLTSANDQALSASQTADINRNKSRIMLQIMHDLTRFIDKKS
ncbi:sulfatase-like hydrolase/transferase [Methylobacillus gramineus]|uniref:sulfatase-like hydrolase/transferase n=1 Tax=Methylobacillus gramineus TaxID=755169 RepID=UPI001CFF76A4|nr:sulfatase-like hydrolase/transferase [Methylobacillus gramineus]MCB5185850.1 sulfatase-like hydrolase/transferase [Methylobacillus gramineus]